MDDKKIDKLLGKIKIVPRPMRFYRKIAMYAMLIAIVLLLITTITNCTVKNKKEKLLEAANLSAQTFEKKLADKEKEYDGAIVLKQDTAKEFPYTQLFPEMMVTPIAPPPVDYEAKVAYLTFDDGPSNLTAGILDILKEKDVKATFFVTGYEIDQYADVVKRAKDEGHIIGIHTFSHNYEEIYASIDAYLTDFNEIFTKVKEITGEAPTIFRFPGGSVNANNQGIYQRLIAEMLRRGFRYYDWSVDTRDGSEEPSTDLILGNVNTSLANDGYVAPVILMHDASTKQATVDALPDVIEAYKTSGFTFSTLNNRETSCFFPYRTELE